ncbi:MAG: hypothetical protein KJ626_06055 [Verrucomicrobia bacterium]|nr:hypothetical protein [Verrucomicrobiota bacterium]
MTSKRSDHTPAVKPELMEKYSSAITLSDMEIFVFPELLYSLVLANIMSPKIWKWREHDWFRKIDKMTPYRRILRLKQFIMDHYEFNLDLDTWGLTKQHEEIARFTPFMDENIISESNALFGYEGDKYYFDLDIRRHFGLDKYSADIIPYWKTETVEAMDAFQYRDGYVEGAGECVSLATLYAAALFVVCKIPLEEIFLTATPLHSQNFVTINEGILTNNRRIVTKKMWFNGTELTGRAQRALRNEQVTIVAHNTGLIHCVYPDATIDKDSYEKFSNSLKSFLRTEVDAEIIANFLREHSSLQKCFQFCQQYHGKIRYIAAEKVYAYEHGSSFKASDDTKEKLLETIDEYEFYSAPIEDRVCVEIFESFFRAHKVDFNDPPSVERLMESMGCPNQRSHEILERLISFCQLEPRLPHEGKKFVQSKPIELDPEMTREQIVASLESIRDELPVVDLSFYALRDMTRTDWTPFLTAAMERNPVSIEASKDMSDDDLIAHLNALPSESIYDSPRLAQPDEVWNFGRGDGVERAICLANIWKQRHPGDEIALTIEPERATLQVGNRTVTWTSFKNLTNTIRLT